MSTYPSLDPKPGSCPPGYRYRHPTYVPGTCISNPKGSTLPDPRCPDGMHWRNTYELKSTCIKQPAVVIKKRLAPDQAPPTKEACQRQDVDPLFQKHLKLIQANLEEYFTVPITKADFVKKNEILRRVRRQFVKSIQKKLQDKDCEYRPSGDDILSINNYFALLVDAFNYNFLTPENWEFIKTVAENDVLLFECRVAVKNFPFRYAFTLHYLDKLHELREALLYMNDNNLLPKQNTFVGRAYHNYIVQFFPNKDNVHGIANVNLPLPYYEQRKNQISLLKKAIALGYLNDNEGPLTEPFVDTVPAFVIPPPPVFPSEDVLPNGRLFSDSEVVNMFGAQEQKLDSSYWIGQKLLQEETAAPPMNKYAKSDSDSSALPNVYLMQSDGKSAISPTTPALQVRPSISQKTPNQTAITLEELRELYDLYVIFEKTYNQLPPSTLTEKGEELQERYNLLFNKLNVYFEKKQSSAKLLNYIENYGESENLTLSFRALESKYGGGPFWEMEPLYFHCPRCDSLIRVKRMLPNQLLECNVCKQKINPAVLKLQKGEVLI